MPMPRSSFTECCVGLVLISPEPPTIGTNVRCMYSTWLRPSSTPICRMASRNGSDSIVAHRAADLDHAHVRIAGAHANAVFDLIGDMRNYLYRRTQVVAAPLLRDHPLVDSARREIAVAAGGHADETLVMAKIEVGFCAVSRDEDFTMLKGTHGSRIHVDVGIQFDHADLESGVLPEWPPRDAEAIPLPSEETTPPVTKTNRVM